MRHWAIGLCVVLTMLVPQAAFAEAQFPITIKHVFGETIIKQAPTRVVTWGWAAQDAALALGVAPVAIPFFGYGGDEKGMLAWTKDGYAALGAPPPTILDNSGGEPPIEQIAAAAPDLIIAVYSGLTEQQYKILSQIAPVVAYPADPWATPWRDVIRITGTALGKADEADALVADLTTWAQAEAAKYPDIKGATFAGIADYNDAVAIYAGRDPRVAFLQDLGLEIAPSVPALAPTDNAFFYSLSFERFEELKSDILISYFADQSEADAFYARPYVAGIEQVEKGAVASLVGAEYVNAVSPPSALSLKWGLPHYLELIGKAAKAARAD